MNKVWVVSWGCDYEGYSGWELYHHQAEAFISAKKYRDGGEWKLKEADDIIGRYHWESFGDHVYVEEMEIK